MTTKPRLEVGQRWLAVVGAAMVVAFFAPWIDLFGHFQRSGFDLATTDAAGWKRHLLWLYPAGGALLAYASFQGRTQARQAALLVGGSVVALAIYDVGAGLVENLRYGAWLTILAAAGAIVSGASKADRGWGVTAGALMIAGFFLPWLGASPHSISGYDLASLPGTPSELGLPSPAWLWAVPVCGAVAMASALSPKARLGAIIAGGGVLLVLGFIYLRVVNLALGWGAWLTLGAGGLALLGALLGRPRRAGAVQKI